MSTPITGMEAIEIESLDALTKMVQSSFPNRQRRVQQAALSTLDIIGFGIQTYPEVGDIAHEFFGQTFVGMNEWKRDLAYYILNEEQPGRTNEYQEIETYRIQELKRLASNLEGWELQRQIWNLESEVRGLKFGALGDLSGRLQETSEANWNDFRDLPQTQRKAFIQDLSGYEKLELYWSLVFRDIPRDQKDAEIEEFRQKYLSPDDWKYIQVNNFSKPIPREVEIKLPVSRRALLQRARQQRYTALQEEGLEHLIPYLKAYEQGRPFTEPKPPSLFPLSGISPG